MVGPTGASKFPNSKLEALQREQISLTEKLNNEDDPIAQTQLMQRLSNNKEAIERLGGEVAAVSAAGSLDTPTGSIFASGEVDAVEFNSNGTGWLLDDRISDFGAREEFHVDEHNVTPREKVVAATRSSRQVSGAQPALRRRLLMGAVALLLVAAVGWFFLLSRSNTAEDEQASDLSSQTGLTTGENVAGPTLSADSRAALYQSDLDRITAATPIQFDAESGEIPEIRKRFLDDIANVMKGYPGIQVKVVGFTDTSGDEQNNQRLSETRAENVKAYLVSKGVPAADLVAEARGESDSSGSSDLANLERNVKFEVVAVGPVVATDVSPIKIGVVTPSSSDDRAFTQSMADALTLFANERGNVTVDISENLFVPAEAEAQIKKYAESDYDLVIGHGVQFGGKALTEIVTAHPDVTFAWGAASDTFDLPNLYAYQVAAEQGGYVMGSMSSMLSETNVVGVVGPQEIPEALRYINGFRAGAQAQSGSTDVLVEYAGTFSDKGLAKEVAERHIAANADVLTGTSQLVPGAISAAQEKGGVAWFGNQSDQASLAPEVVVASQVYHWEVALRQIVGEMDSGTRQGKSLLLDMANGGIEIRFNPSYPLPADVRQRADEVVNGIVGGSITVSP